MVLEVFEYECYSHSVKIHAVVSGKDSRDVTRSDSRVFSKYIQEELGKLGVAFYEAFSLHGFGTHVDRKRMYSVGFILLM